MTKKYNPEQQRREGNVIRSFLSRNTMNGKYTAAAWAALYTAQHSTKMTESITDNHRNKTSSTTATVTA